MREGEGDRTREPSSLSCPLRAGRAMAETDGKIETVLYIGSLRAFAPLDLGLVKSKESGRPYVVHACAKVRAVQPRAAVKTGAPDRD